METALALTIGALVAAAAYMLLARDLPRALLGFVLLGTAANLTIFAAGALAAEAANPLPQALVLTAIVIGFGLAAFALVLVMRAHAAFGSTAAEDMDEAERPDEVPAAAPPAPRPAAARKEAA